jgi:hypothetical protein
MHARLTLFYHKNIETHMQTHAVWVGIDVYIDINRPIETRMQTHAVWVGIVPLVAFLECFGLGEETQAADHVSLRCACWHRH